MDCFFSTCTHTCTQNQPYCFYKSSSTGATCHPDAPRSDCGMLCTSENTGLELSSNLFYISPIPTHIGIIIVQVLCPSKIVKVMDAVGVL